MYTEIRTYLAKIVQWTQAPDQWALALAANAGGRHDAVLGILRTRCGELVASGNLLYCFVVSDASCGTLLGTLVSDWISPYICCGTDESGMIALNIYSVLLLACGKLLCTAVGGQSQRFD